jgi:hypothetical protein
MHETFESRALDWRPLRKTMLDAEDVEDFERALREAEESHLILSLASFRPIPRNGVDAAIERMLTGVARKHRIRYGRELVACLMQLERDGLLLSQDRARLICLLRLPRP